MRLDNFATIARLLLLLLVLLPITAGGRAILINRGGHAAVGEPTFTPLHLYYMSATGSDTANGLTPATAWATPNHAVVCGDVILVQPGTYSASQFAANWGTVSSCPSTSGGIDGAGGIYAAVALCAGTDLTSCQITGTARGADGQVEFYGGNFNIQNNWAFEGFYLSGTGGDNNGIMMRPCDGSGPNDGKMHHFAFVNNIIFNQGQAIGFNDCGGSSGVSNDFVDYVAAVGNIVQNGNQHSICLGAVDYVGLGDWDTAAGTHAYMYTNYGINNQSPSCVSKFDGEAFYIDTSDAHLFDQQAVIANNIGYLSTRNCIALTFGAKSNPTATFKIYNNTCFNNVVLGALAGEGAGGDNGEINLNTGNNNTTWTISLTNNIGYNNNTFASGGGGNTVKPYALDVWFAIPAAKFTFGGTGTENIFDSVQTTCNTNCDGTFSIEFNAQPVPSGTNFLGVNPSFTNSTDLLTNQTGVPNCTGFVNTTACMGWNATAATLTTPSVISDLRAGCAQCTGKGFQLPSTTCVSNTDYPTWLKGLVYLHWNSSNSTIIEKADLATKPCGM